MNIGWTLASISGIASGPIVALLVIARLVFGRRAPRPGRWPAVLLSMAAVAALGAAGARSAFGDTTAAGQLAKERAQPRLTRVVSETMRPVLESAAFRERMQGLSPEEANALAWQLSSEGLLRLSDERLIRRLRLLNEAISTSDEETCASQLLGATPEQADRLLANLSDESLFDWFALSAEALAASLADEPLRTPTQAEIEEALHRLLAALPEAEAQSLADALAHPTTLDPSEACRAARTIYGTAVHLPEGDRALVARVLAER